MIKLKNYGIYYVFSFFQFFIFELTGTSVILFILDKGYSLQDANLLMLMLFFLGLLLEIPTGVIADKYGRKFSTLVGLCTYIIYCFLFAFTKSFPILLFNQVLGATSLCLISGSMEAWIAENTEKNIDTVFSVANSIQYTSGIFCGIVGSYLASINYVFPWLASILLNAILILFLAKSVKEHGSIRLIDSKTNNTLPNFIKESYLFIKQNKYLWFIFFFVFMIGLSNSSANTFQQPRLVALSGQDVWIMGYIKSGYSLFMVFGSILVKRLTRKYTHINILRLTCVMLGFWLTLSGVFNSFYLVLITFFIYEVGRGMYNPAVQIYTNTMVKDYNRATMLSIQSSFNQLGVCLGLFLTGLISKNYTDIDSDQSPIRISWIICGIFALVPLLLMWKKNKKNT